MRLKLIALFPFFIISCGERFQYTYTDEWLSSYNIYAYGRPPLDYLFQMNVNVIAWSVYHGGLNAEDLEYVRKLHARGIKVASNFPTMQASLSVVGDSDLEMYSARDIYLNPVKALWIQPDSPYLPCHNNPYWQDFLKERIKEHIDGEVDAVHFDEIEGTGGHLYLAGFCDFCMDGFRNYLKSKYTYQELVSFFGIYNIDDFNYREYLINNGGKSLSDDPNPLLRKEFIRFQVKSRKEQMKELIEYAKEYANRPIFFAGNIFFYNALKHPFFELLDFTVSENFVELPPYTKHIGTYILARAISGEKPVVMFPTIIDLKALTFTNHDWHAVAFRLAEASSAGASFLIPHNAYVFGGGTSTVTGGATLPVEIGKHITDFIKEHREELSVKRYVADVGIFYDFSCAFDEYTEKGYLTPWFPGGKVHNGYLGMAMILTEAHIPFTAVYEGDGDLVKVETHSQEFSDIKVLIVPYNPCLSFDPYNKVAELEQRGVKIVYVKDAHLLWTSHREDVKESALSTILQVLGNDLLITTSASSNIGIVPVENKYGEILIHFLNYNYNPSAHSFLPTSPFNITFCVRNFEERTVDFFTPQGNLTVEFQKQKNCITGTIPSFKMWGFVKL